MAGPLSSQGSDVVQEEAALSSNSVQSLKASSLIRSLGTSDKRTRDRGLAVLTKWLKARKEIQEDELRKLWKGLFYCFWHTDKVPVQADLARSMAAMLHALDPAMSLRFFSVFLVTMGREWPGIDRLRLDKFCLLLRSFISSMFSLLASNNWKEEIVGSFMTSLRDIALLGDDRHAALGMKLHIGDVYVEELRKVAALSKISMFPLLEPFCACLQKASDKRMLERVQRRIFSGLIEATRQAYDSRRSPSATGLDSEVAVRVQEGGLAADDVQKIRKCLFDVAAAPDTATGNRRVLYSLHEELNVLEGLLVAEVERGKVKEGKSASKSGGDTSAQPKRRKKVRFSLKSNLLFDKNGPVPPPIVRTPPSASPRGSALKAGVSPGPINQKRLVRSAEKLKKLKVVNVTPFKVPAKGRRTKATQILSMTP